MADEGQENGAYQLITPPNLLKAKVGKGGPGGIDPDLIRHAETVIDSMVDEFSETVSREILHVMELAMDLESDPAKASEILKDIRRVSHDLRGQGATYGYDLITEVAECLFRYTSLLSNATALNPDVLRAHADAMRAVVKNDVKGDGGAIGIDLVASLDALISRMTG
jgi:chemotaxis protein histidine kinase CheA